MTTETVQQLTETQVIQALLFRRWQRTFCMPNYTPSGWWECDLFELTEAGYFKEYEVKLTRADFFHDAEKEQEYGNRWTKDGRTPSDLRKKHDLLRAGDPRGPVQFWYVTPPGLVTFEEVPEFAGLMEIRSERFVAVRKEAPRLHNEKLSEKIEDHARGVCYYRMHNLRDRMARKLSPDQPKRQETP